MTLEVFTSRKSAEAELWSIERLAPDKYYPRAANKHQEQLAEGESDETLSNRIVEYAGYELVEMLKTQISHIYDRSTTRRQTHIGGSPDRARYGVRRGAKVATAMDDEEGPGVS